MKPSRFGPVIQDPVKPSFSTPEIRKETIMGEIIHIDGFGNLITNISEENLKATGISEGEELSIQLNGERLKLKLCSSYGEVARSMPLCIIGGTGFLEVSVNQGNASKILGVKIGAPVILRRLNLEC